MGSLLSIFRMHCDHEPQGRARLSQAGGAGTKILPLLHPMEERVGERRVEGIPGFAPLLDPLPTPASRAEGEEKHARKNLAENDRIRPIRIERAADDTSPRRGEDTAPYRTSGFMAPMRVQNLEVEAFHE
jgi:hypothetical protein